jgi:hypothetical protein
VSNYTHTNPHSGAWLLQREKLKRLHKYCVVGKSGFFPPQQAQLAGDPGLAERLRKVLLLQLHHL